MTPARPTELAAEVQIALGTALASLERQLQVGLGLKLSRSLRMIALGDRLALHIQFPYDAGWGVITPHAFTLARARPLAFGKPPTRHFADLMSDGALVEALNQRGNADRFTRGAARLVSALLESDRQTFRQLAEWAPMIETAVYAISARIVMALDATRADVLDACAENRSDADVLAMSYHRLTKALERATLIATEHGSARLVDTAKSFDWTNWTPSFPLSRERTLLGTLIGVRAASRLGPSLIDPYLDAFARARHPLKALDALVGLTAIALRHKSQRDGVIRRLEAILANLPDTQMPRPDLLAVAFLQARSLLEDTGVAAQLHASSWRHDAFSTNPAGQIRVFRYMPAALQDSIGKFVPPVQETAAGLSRHGRELFTRAWSPGKPNNDADGSTSVDEA